jgi:recombination protein RecA
VVHYQGERLGQGRESVRGMLKENREIFGRIDSELRKKLGIVASTDVDIPAAPEDGAEAAAAVVKPRRGSAAATN